MLVPMLPAVITALDGKFVLHRRWEQPDQPRYLDELGPRI